MSLRQGAFWSARQTPGNLGRMKPARDQSETTLGRPKVRMRRASREVLGALLLTLLAAFFVIIALSGGH